jgi:hypothetical protein
MLVFVLQCPAKVRHKLCLWTVAVFSPGFERLSEIWARSKTIPQPDLRVLHGQQDSSVLHGGWFSDYIVVTGEAPRSDNQELKSTQY